jgi:endothelin-converting enzyme/putative endopeptidase
MKGGLVAGEASADLVGVRIAYEAFLKAQQGQPREVKEGLNPEQRFFVAFARYHAAKLSPDFKEYVLENDPHPLAEFRVNQTLKNLPAFAAAFALAPTAAMSLATAERAVIW